MLMLILEKQYSSSDASLYLLGLTDKTSRNIREKKSLLSSQAAAWGSFSPETLLSVHISAQIRAFCFPDYALKYAASVEPHWN